MRPWPTKGRRCGGDGTGGGERWPAIRLSLNGDGAAAERGLARADATWRLRCCTTVAVAVAAAVADDDAADAGNGWRKTRADEPTRASTADGNCRNRR